MGILEVDDALIPRSQQNSETSSVNSSILDTGSDKDYITNSSDSSSNQSSISSSDRPLVPPRFRKKSFSSSDIIISTIGEGGMVKQSTSSGSSSSIMVAEFEIDSADDVSLLGTNSSSTSTCSSDENRPPTVIINGRNHHHHQPLQTTTNTTSKKNIINISSSSNATRVILRHDPSQSKQVYVSSSSCNSVSGSSTLRKVFSQQMQKPKPDDRQRRPAKLLVSPTTMNDDKSSRQNVESYKSNAMFPLVTMVPQHQQQTNMNIANANLGRLYPVPKTRRKIEHSNSHHYTMPAAPNHQLNHQHNLPPGWILIPATTHQNTYPLVLNSGNCNFSNFSPAAYLPILLNGGGVSNPICWNNTLLASSTRGSKNGNRRFKNILTQQQPLSQMDFSNMMMMQNSVPKSSKSKMSKGSLSSDSKKNGFATVIWNPSKNVSKVPNLKSAQPAKSVLKKAISTDNIGASKSSSSHSEFSTNTKNHHFHKDAKKNVTFGSFTTVQVPIA